MDSMSFQFPGLIADTFDADFWTALARSLRMPVLPHRHTSIFHNGREFFAVYCTERTPGQYEDFNVEALSKKLAHQWFSNGSMRRKFVEQLP